VWFTLATSEVYLFPCYGSDFLGAIMAHGSWPSYLTTRTKLSHFLSIISRSNLYQACIWLPVSCSASIFGEGGA
jgi:hypothetical protein